MPGPVSYTHLDVYKRQAYADPENEALIQQAISKLVAGKSLIVVAHRLNTIRNADVADLNMKNFRVSGFSGQFENLGSVVSFSYEE